MQWYLVGIFVGVLAAVMLIFYTLGFFKVEKSEQAPKVKAEHKPKAKKQLIAHIKQRFSSFIRDIKASPHYKTRLIMLSASLLILLIFLAGYFGNEDVRVKRRLEIIASEFDQRVNSQPVEIEITAPSASELRIYEDNLSDHKLFNRNTAIPEKPKAKWYRRKIFLTSTSYDARKTDSLVSPFIADIHFNCAVRGRIGGTKASVESGEDSFTSSPTECISKYAFQEDHWVKKSISCKSNFTGIWETPTIQEHGTIYQCSALLPQSD